MTEDAARFSEKWFTEQGAASRPPLPPEPTADDILRSISSVGANSDETAHDHQIPGNGTASALGLGERVAALLEQQRAVPSPPVSQEPATSYQQFAAGQQELASLRSHAASLVMDKIEAAEAEGARIRAAARQDADDIRARAHQDAAALRAEAESEAARIRGQASERLAAMMSAAEAEIREFLEGTTKEAEQVQAQTWSAVQDLVTDARALTTRLEGYLGAATRRSAP